MFQLISPGSYLELSLWFRTTDVSTEPPARRFAQSFTHPPTTITHPLAPLTHLLAALTRLLASRCLLCNTLLASRACSAALIHSFTHSQACGKANDKMSQYQAVLNHSAWRSACAKVGICRRLAGVGFFGGVFVRERRFLRRRRREKYGE